MKYKIDPRPDGFHILAQMKPRTRWRDFLNEGGDPYVFPDENEARLFCMLITEGAAFQRRLSSEWERFTVPLKPEEILYRSSKLDGACGGARRAAEKHVRHVWGDPGGLPYVDARAKLSVALADVVIRADRLADAYGISLKHAVTAKFNKTSLERGLKTRI